MSGPLFGKALFLPAEAMGEVSKTSQHLSWGLKLVGFGHIEMEGGLFP